MASEVGQKLIESMSDFCQTLRRGERLGAHYKITTWYRCPSCNKPTKNNVNGDTRCDGCRIPDARNEGGIECSKQANA